MDLATHEMIKLEDSMTWDDTSALEAVPMGLIDQTAVGMIDAGSLGSDQQHRQGPSAGPQGFRGKKAAAVHERLR